MKIKKKIVQIGASYGIIFDKVILQSMDLDSNNEVWVTIEKINKLPKDQNKEQIKKVIHGNNKSKS